jgi:hypothetical protein
MPLQIRRGLQAERQAMTVPLASGELLYVTDDQRLYIGNGTTLGGIQVTGYTDEDAQEAVAELLLGASPITAADNSRHTGITFTYDDNDNRIDATVDFSGLAVLEADAFKGSLFADDSMLLVDAVAGSINLDGTVKGDIIPNVNEVYNIGSVANKFNNIHLSSDGLYLGDAQITATGTSINLPLGSTVGGVEIGRVPGRVGGDLQGSVFGEDSTVLVDATNNVLTNGSIVVQDSRIFTNVGDGALYLQGDYNSQTLVIFPTLAASTTGPNYEVGDAGNNWNLIDIRGYKNDVIDSTEDIELGDVLGVLGISGENRLTGNDMGIKIGVQCDPAGSTALGGNPTGHIPTKLFIINKGATSSSPDVAMIFDSLGRLAVNQENAQATLDVNGFAKLAILTAAPSTLANGMIAIADGTSWDPLGAAGKQQMVVYLGGAWRAIAQEP